MERNNSWKTCKGHKGKYKSPVRFVEGPTENRTRVAGRLGMSLRIQSDNRYTMEPTRQLL